MAINLELKSQEEVTGLCELLMVAAKAPSVNNFGMKLALNLLDEVRAAVAVAAEGNAPKAETEEGHA